MEKHTKRQVLKKTISSESSIRGVIDAYPETALVFLRYGLHCAGCPMAGPETLNDIADLHGVEVKKLIDDLNKAIKKKTK